MAARPRKTGRKDWPANLYPHKSGNKTHYLWRNPISGRQHSLKCPDNLQLAKQRAAECNAGLAMQIEWMPPAESKFTLRQWTARWVEHVKTRRKVRPPDLWDFDMTSDPQKLSLGA